jgi:hydroxymethylglutaryl-CoA reductase
MKKGQEAITADPGKMREFLIRVNTDVEFRRRFLEKPIEVLNSNGFILSPEAESEVKATVRCMNNVSGIAKLPMGYERFLKNIDYKGKIGHYSEKTVGLWID